MAEKEDVAEKISKYLDKYGPEETGKLLCRSLIGIAESSSATEIRYSDEKGDIHVSTRHKKHQIH
tara:strand:+ start:810 stop:1004 length:195 start_codon:yes stop_codon:yes gene_type:complete